MGRRSFPDIKPGQVIEINHRPVFGTTEGFTPTEAEVVDLLSIQFTARLLDGTNGLTYRFYHDYGDSWRLKE